MKLYFSGTSQQYNYINIHGGGNEVCKKNITDITINKIKNKFIDYKKFKEIYGVKNKKINLKYINALQNIMYDILPLNNKIYDTYDTHIKKINYTYSLSKCDLFNLFIDYFNIDNIKLISYEMLFYSYKNMIEKLVEIFIKLKNDNINDLKNTWNAYNIENNIDTSSILLYFLFNDHKIGKYKWDLPNTNTNKNINNNINEFLDKIQTLNFKYLGFCPYAYKKRLHAILIFPVEELLECIKIMDHTNNYIHIYNAINKLKKYIQNNQKVIKNYSNNCLPNLLKEIDPKKKLNKNITEIDKINNTAITYSYLHFIKYIFNLYIEYTQDLLILENNYYKLSISIDNILDIIKEV